MAQQACRYEIFRTIAHLRTLAKKAVSDASSEDRPLLAEMLAFLRHQQKDYANLPRLEKPIEHAARVRKVFSDVRVFCLQTFGAFHSERAPHLSLPAQLEAYMQNYEGSPASAFIAQEKARGAIAVLTHACLRCGNPHALMSTARSVIETVQWNAKNFPDVVVRQEHILAVPGANGDCSPATRHFIRGDWPPRLKLLVDIEPPQPSLCPCHAVTKLLILGETVE
jgi:hypothetical protein